MKRRRFLICIAAALAVMFAFLLFGCDKYTPKQVSLSDIYRNYPSTDGEINAAELSLVLPDGWQVLTDVSSGRHVDSDIGYIASLNAFIVVNKEGALSIARVPSGEDKRVAEEDLLFPASTGVQAVHVSGDLIAARLAGNGGRVGVMSAEGKWLIDPSKTANVAPSDDSLKSSTLSSAIRILDNELVAIAPAYEADPETADTANRSYTPIYRISTGKMACRVRSGGSLSGIVGFDGEYVSVETSDSSSGRLTQIYKVPTQTGASPNLAYPVNGNFANPNTEDDYYSESVYLGGGKFYVHTEWTVDPSDDYTYSYDGEYYRTERYFYYPSDDSRVQYVSSYIFLNCVNSYYDNAPGRSVDGNTSVVPSTFLNPGYTYSSFGLMIASDKTAYYDQFILDNDLNIVLSLTGNFGIELEGAYERDEVGIYDLMMQGSDGVYYARVKPSAIRVYRADGSLAFSAKNDYDYLSVGIQNGVIIASIDKDGKQLYGAYDMQGREIIPFEYKQIEPFRSYYTYALTADGKTRVLLGVDGVAAPSEDGGHFPDVATAGNTPLIKRGCYAFKTTVDGETRYGVKNMSGDYDGNVVLDAILSGITIYSPSTDNSRVFVFGERAEDGAYSVYSLVSRG